MFIAPAAQDADRLSEERDVMSLVKELRRQIWLVGSISIPRRWRCEQLFPRTVEALLLKSLLDTLASAHLDSLFFQTDSASS
jgi:hypothetical protein